MTEIPEGRTARALDADVRRHLSFLLTATQCGTDDQVAALARMEAHRLIGAVIAGPRDHRLDDNDVCTVCRAGSARSAVR